MILIICIFFIIWCIDGICEASDHAAERHNDNLRAERRHRELMHTIRNKKSTRKYTRRRVAKSKNLTLGEEVNEEFDEE